MPVLSTAGALGLATLSGLGTLGSSVAQMAYNKAEAQRNRDFQEHMRDTSLESMVNQATRLGISPSLVLGGGSTSLGGSQASISGNRSAMASGVNQFLDYLKHENQLKTMEEMNEDKLNTQSYIAHERNEALKQRQEMINENIRKMSNSVNSKKTSYQGRKYTDEELNSLWDDIDKIDLY